ncbi:thyroid hormone receptor interactor 6 [Homo sapiens]|uniref:Isoform 2 of Thyroid receptor-interacting protein 6 n=1 Tax=Homo sapiens TaxID=9606 RepID=Q15654-2|nr:thyroid hormone receptor interactor 6 [Homo sapiens]KAI4015026.1 thyroid hormone receptor interactor 6 [Homo sapiens]BAK20497.1 thyroid hormone receptor interacting protein 6 isoform 2 [Homo sapiens]
MSGPTWLPPKQPEPARAPQGRAIPRGTPGPPPAHGAVLPGPRGTGGSGAGVGGVPWSTPAHAGAPCRQGGPSPWKPGRRDRLAEQHAGRAEWGSGSCVTATRPTGI